MGCYFHKERVDNNRSKGGEKKEYSWDKRRQSNCSEFIIHDVVDNQVNRYPGSVNGQQLIIQNCENSEMYILDYMNSVVVDDCVNCKIVLGAVKGSIFLRDCNDCVCVVACGQFRARDCRKLDIFLCCSTRPVLESSSSIHFGCYQLFYTGLQEHFTKCNLSPFNNDWSNIHDFTPIEGESNWCLLPDTLSIQDYVSVPDSEELNDLGFTFYPEKSIVPQTWGPHKIVSGQICFVVIFHEGDQLLRANKFVNSMKMENRDCLLLLAKERRMTSREAELTFNCNTYNTAVLNGPVIGLQLCGPNCCHVCEKIASDYESDFIYVSTNAEITSHQADMFFNSRMSTSSNFNAGSSYVKDLKKTHVTGLLCTNTLQ